MNAELDEIKKIKQTFASNLDKINNLIENNFLDEAVILIVAILEVFWKDLFKINKELWFSHLNEIGLVGGGTIEEEINNRKNIRTYLKSIRVYDDFLRSYYIYQVQTVNADIESIFEALFENNNDKINFQNLTMDNGVKKAYKAFFDINLTKFFHENTSESGKIWTKLTDLFKERHEIIHAGRSTSFSETELNELLESIKVMEFNLLKKICAHWGILLDWVED
jgi:hypothetical protein